MIKANELRIGNWLITARGIPQQVAYIGETIGFHNEIGGTDKHQKNPIFSYDIAAIQPIPLTPEILEKCGFVKYEEEIKAGINDVLEIWEGDYGISFFFDIYGGLVLHNYHCNMNRPKYLHQLQNLYWCLCGEELKVDDFT